jgi:hypothetical protein
VCRMETAHMHVGKAAPHTGMTWLDGMSHCICIRQCRVQHTRSRTREGSYPHYCTNALISTWKTSSPSSSLHIRPSKKCARGVHVSEVNSKCILPQAASALPLPSHSQSYVLPCTLSIMSFCHPVPCLVRNTAVAAQKSLNSSPLNLPSIVVSTRGWHPIRDLQLPHSASEAQRPDTSPRVARPSP